MHSGRVVFLNSIFPVLSETFLYSQYTKMKAEGLNMVLVSSNEPSADQVHPWMEELKAEVDYLSHASASEALCAHFKTLFKHPKGYIRALLKSISVEESFVTTLKHLTGAALVIAKAQPNDWNHSHFTYGATSIAMWCKRIAGTPFSITLHGSDLTFDNPPDLYTKLREADCIVCISEFNADYVRKNFPRVEGRNLEVLPLGVAPLSPAPAPKQVKADVGSKECPLEVLSVGRLSTQKAQEYLVQACAKLAKEGLYVNCTLVGEGPQREFLEAEIARLDASEYITLTGAKFHDEVLALYKDADVFVMSSVAEGMPIVLMEAMQAGVPVISTAISGIPELLDHGNAGVLVPTHDADAIADAMRDMISGQIDTADLSQCAQTFILENFDQGKNAIRFKELLEKLVGSRR